MWMTTPGLTLIILSFQAAIHCDEDVETRLGKGEERTVFAGAPTRLGNRLNGVAGKGPFETV